MADVIIGSARHDENGTYTGGAAGDSLQTEIPDYSGEVSMQDFYVHSKGWYVLVPSSATLGKAIAEAMITACNNSNIGYDQNNRLGIITYGTSSAIATECDCSSLVRECVIEASGSDPGNFTTATEAAVLVATGLFTKYTYTSGMLLKPGYILVTQSKGHTVVVCYGDSWDDGYPQWVQDSQGYWYYRIAEGENAHGWMAITNADGIKRWYYFDDSGEMLTDWQEIGGKWYYFQPSGSLEGALYHTDDSGAQIIWEIE